MNPDSSDAGSPPKLRDRQRQAAAQEILAAAEQLFAERGVHGTHMSDIASRAGVAVGTLYNHFADRDALLRALIGQYRTELLARVDACLAQVDGKPLRAQLRAVVATAFASFEQHWQLFATLMSAECGTPATVEHARKIQIEMLKRYEVLVERGRKQRAVRPKVAPLLPTLMLGMLRSVLMRRVFVPEEGPAEQHIDVVVDVILHGASGKQS